MEAMQDHSQFALKGKILLSLAKM